MRPSDITDGIRPGRKTKTQPADSGGFNEAVGYYRRNRWFIRACDDPDCASMRPSDITDGIDMLT